MKSLTERISKLEKKLSKIEESQEITHEALLKYGGIPMRGAFGKVVDRRYKEAKSAMYGFEPYMLNKDIDEEPTEETS